MIYKYLKYLSLPQNEEVVKYGENGDLFYIILKGTVGVKVPITSPLFMTQRQFVDFYIANHHEVILSKTSHHVSTHEMSEKESFLDYVTNRLAKGMIFNGMLTIFK